MTEELSQARLKEVFCYNAETGVFTWMDSRGSIKAGDVAGYLGNRGYLVIGFAGRMLLVHRLAWLYVYGVWPKNIDHINHNRSDNRLSNLREVTRRENQKNQKKFTTNTSGVTGVYWHKSRRKWWSQVVANGETIYLGIFSDKFEAICARKSANNKYGFHENHGI